MSAATILLHPGAPLAPHDLPRAWLREPAAALALVALGLAYAAGVARLWRRAGRGRGVSTARVATFAAGWLALGTALVSPLHALGGALFSAHMAQHTLLIAVAAPLLALGRPEAALAWALPRGWHRAAAITNHVTPRGLWLTTGLASAALWLWHAPALYALTLRSDVAHAAQHATFLGTAWLHWRAVFATRARRPAAGAVALFVVALQSGALGALIALAPRLLIPAYAATTAPWGLTPLEDQQLAGLIMWIPGGVTYLVAALALLATALREKGSHAPKGAENYRID